MASRPAPILAAVLVPLLLCAPACAKSTGPATQTPQLVAPQTISDLDDYAQARNAYALLSLDDAARPAARTQLRTYLLGYLERAISNEQLPQSIEALEQLSGLWVASELRTLSPDPELAAAAERVYAQVAPAGDERPALLAIGISQAFSDSAGQAQAERSYAELEEWIQRTSEFGSEPGFDDHLDRLLEDVTALFPSPYLVDALAEVYLDRYRGAQRQGHFSSVSDPRVPFTGYLLARLYLRADDLDAAVAALDRLEIDAPTKALRDLIHDAAEASRSGRSPADLDQLTREFLPEPDNRLPKEIVTQGWGIVDNLAGRSLARFPDHPPAHLARGRALRSRNYVDAAIVHYERAFAGKTRASDREDLHRAWSELAQLYQFALEVRAEAGGPTTAMLERVEGFHDRAAHTWPQRPIEPGITLAWMSVAMSEFNAGHIDRAAALMEKAITLSPHPAAIALLGTIATRRGQFDDARAQLRRLDKLAGGLGDQLDRYDWQIQARIGLAEVEALADAREASVTELREALRLLNTLLSYPGLADPLRAEFTLRRARVFFYLGEIELAMTDVRDTQRLAPERDDAYTEPLIFTVVHAHLDEAGEIFAAALARDAGGGELGVYYSLWILDLAQRLGQPAPVLARDYLGSYAANNDAEPWQRKLARHGLGQLSYVELSGAASDTRERSEAAFYEGLARWRDGSHAAGLELMSEVLDQQMMGDFEYQMAQSYLRWNELPKTARAALEHERRGG